MRRPVVLAGSPRIEDRFLKSTRTLFDEAGGNTGNLAFRYGLARHVEDVVLSHWDAPVEEVRAAADVLLLPLANQLGPHTDLGHLADRIEAFGLPVVGIGLGAQAASTDEDVVLTAGTERWLRTIAAHAPSDHPNLGVRGAYTQQQVERLGLGDAVVVTGCPSAFLDLRDDLGTRLSAHSGSVPRHVAVTAGIPYVPALRDLERSLAQLVTDTGGAYVVQHALEMVHLARDEHDLIDPGVLELCRDHIRPELDPAAFRTWCRRHAHAFFDVEAWVEFLRRFDVVVGTRFHGAVLAVQAGVPAGVVATDSRTRELCETHGLPVRTPEQVQGPLTPERLPELFPFDVDHFLERRRTVHAAYAQVLQDAQIATSDAFDLLP